MTTLFCGVPQCLAVALPVTKATSDAEQDGCDREADEELRNTH
jgi:hypothetical protein